MAERLTGLYGITPDWEDQRLFSAAERALEAGLKLLQYRHKSADAEARTRQARHLAGLCRRYDARLIVNDDPALAASVEAAGVHLGRDDGRIEQARHVIGRDALIGVSCYDDRARALRAMEAGADYVAFGAVYPSTVKPEAVAAPLDLFSWARSQGLNSVAIGGLTAANAAPVIAAGADALAVITALFHAPDIARATQTFNELFASP